MLRSFAHRSEMILHGSSHMFNSEEDFTSRSTVTLEFICITLTLKGMCSVNQGKASLSLG